MAYRAHKWFAQAEKGLNICSRCATEKKVEKGRKMLFRAFDGVEWIRIMPLCIGKPNAKDVAKSKMKRRVEE